MSKKKKKKRQGPPKPKPTYTIEQVREVLAGGPGNVIVSQRQDGGIAYEELGFSINDVCAILRGLKSKEFKGTAVDETSPDAPTADCYVRRMKCPASEGLLDVYIKFSIVGKLLLISFHGPEKNRK